MQFLSEVLTSHLVDCVICVNNGWNDDNDGLTSRWSNFASCLDSSFCHEVWCCTKKILLILLIFFFWEWFFSVFHFMYVSKRYYVFFYSKCNYFIGFWNKVFAPWKFGINFSNLSSNSATCVLSLIPFIY